MHLLSFPVINELEYIVPEEDTLDIFQKILTFWNKSNLSRFRLLIVICHR